MKFDASSAPTYGELVVEERKADGAFQAELPMEHLHAMGRRLLVPENSTWIARCCFLHIKKDPHLYVSVVFLASSQISLFPG